VEQSPPPFFGVPSDFARSLEGWGPPLILLSFFEEGMVTPWRSWSLPTSLVTVEPPTLSFVFNLTLLALPLLT